MGTIPAPNIVQDTASIATAPQNALAEFARVAQLKQQTAEEQQQQQAMALENQEKQRQLADQDAFTKTIAGFDPTKNTIADIPKMITSNGGSGQAAINAQNGLVQQKQNLLKLSDDQFAQQQHQADLIQGVHDEVTQAKPEDKQTVYSQGLARLGAAGVDVSKEPTQYPGDDQFAQHLAPIQLHSAIVDDAAKQREADQNAAKARNENAQAAMQEFKNKLTQNSKPGDFDKQIDNIVPVVPGNAQSQAQNQFVHSQVDGFLSRGDTDNANHALEQAYQNQLGIGKDIAVATNPQIQAGKVAVATAEGKARAAIQNGPPINIPQGVTGEDALKYLDPNVASAVRMIGDGKMDFATFASRSNPQAKQALAAAVAAYNPNFDQNTFKVRGGVEKSATSGDIGKNITAYNTAIAHATQLQSAADALQNNDVRGLNKIGNALGYQFGSDATTNFNVIKNALSGEISKVFKGGEASDAEIRAVEEPFNNANSPAQLKGAIDNAIHLMNSKRDALKQQYEQGMQGRPNFGGGATPSGGDFFSQFGGKKRTQ